MIKKFEQYINENYKSNPILIDGNTYYMNSEIKNKKLYVSLIYKGDLYEELSVVIPESDNINDDEFFLNPKVKYSIVSELENQKFIQKLNKRAKAGNRETVLYCII
jgi:hypothetical protein